MQADNLNPIDEFERAVTPQEDINFSSGSINLEPIELNSSRKLRLDS